MNELEEFVELLVKDKAEPTLALPDPQLITYYTDLKDRRYWLDCEINDNVLELAWQIFLWNSEDKDIPIEKRKPIKILFNSPGGSLDIEETLVSIIKLSKTPVYGIALGMVASAASLIYLSCHKRYALPNAYWLLHKGSCTNVSGSFSDVQAAMEDYRIQVEKMEQFYIENTGYTEEEIKKGLVNDWYVRVPEALEKGIVTDLIEDIEIFL